MASMKEYLPCVDDEMSAKGDDAPAEYKSLMVSRHNAAVSEMESVASRVQRSSPGLQGRAIHAAEVTR